MQPAQEASVASQRLKAALALGMVVLAAAGYSFTRSPGPAGAQPEAASAVAPAVAPAAALAPAAVAVAAEPEISDAQVLDVVAQMAQRLQDKPDDALGWSLLARAYAGLGRHAEAAAAYKRLLALDAAPASVLADYADTLAALNGGPLNAQAQRLVERALALEPENVRARALAGSAAFDRRDYAGAVLQWERAARALPADSRFQPQLQASIAQARQLGGMPAAASASASASAPFTAPGGFGHDTPTSTAARP